MRPECAPGPGLGTDREPRCAPWQPERGHRPCGAVSLPAQLSRGVVAEREGGPGFAASNYVDKQQPTRHAAASRRIVARLSPLASGRPAPLSVPQPREIGQRRTRRTAQPARPPHLGAEERELPRLLLIERFRYLLSAASRTVAAAAAAADHGWRTWCTGRWRRNFGPGSLLSELYR